MKTFLVGFICSVVVAAAVGFAWNTMEVETAAFNSTPYMRLN